MSSKSNRFVSAAALLALLAGCHSAPPRPAPAAPPPLRRRGPPARARLRPQRRRRAERRRRQPRRVPRPHARQPGRSPQCRLRRCRSVRRSNMRRRLNLMKAGRNTDAELEFKQLALAYPDYAGPEVNLGLLYLRASRFGDAEAAFNAALEAQSGQRRRRRRARHRGAQARKICARPRRPTSVPLPWNPTTLRRISTWACCTTCISASRKRRSSNSSIT